MEMWWDRDPPRGTKALLLDGISGVSGIREDDSCTSAMLSDSVQYSRACGDSGSGGSLLDVSS